MRAARSDNLAQTIVILVQIAHDPFWSLVLGHKLTNFYIGRKSTTYYLLKVIIYPKSQRSILQNSNTTTCRKNSPSEVWISGYKELYVYRCVSSFLPSLQYAVYNIHSCPGSIVVCEDETYYYCLEASPSQRFASSAIILLVRLFLAAKRSSTPALVLCLYVRLSVRGQNWISSQLQSPVVNCSLQ